MDLRSDNAFWAIKNGIIQKFPPLAANETCDVVILGGGITGALLAEAFTKAGIGTIVVDKRPIAHGSTSASTALLQYEIDEPLYALAAKIGKQEAITAYTLCAQAIEYIAKLAERIGSPCDFEKRPSLYFSTNAHDQVALKKEYIARKEANFAVDWLTKKDVKRIYNFEADCAIRSEIGAQMDPYRFTYSLLDAVQKRGGKVFEATNIIKVQTEHRVLLTSEAGYTIQAKKMVFAVGYEVKAYLKEKTAALKSTYACVSQPLHEKLHWPEKCLLWNTDDPYFYARITKDNRILMGGADIDYEADESRDRLIPEKQKTLHHIFKKLFPHIPLDIAYTWAGTFGATKDGLPYIGESPEWRNAYFALGYGGNGITFSAIAAQALTDMYLGNKCAYVNIFKFGR